MDFNCLSPTQHVWGLDWDKVLTGDEDLLGQEKERERKPGFEMRDDTRLNFIN